MKRLPFVALAGVSLLGLLLASAELPGHRHEARAATRRGIHKIRHVVIVTQEKVLWVRLEADRVAALLSTES